MLFARRPIWTSRRARGASSPRLYVVRRIRKIPPFVAKQKVFGIPIPRAQKESASSLRSTRALRVDDGERSTQTRKQKKKKMSNDDRACASYFFVAVLFDSFATTIPLSRCVYRRPKDGGGVCVCVDIRKNISLCHSCLFLPTINRIIKGRLLKKNSWLSRVFRSKKSTHPRHGKWKRTFSSSTDKKKGTCVVCRLFFFYYRVQKP